MRREDKSNRAQSHILGPVGSANRSRHATVTQFGASGGVHKSFERLPLGRWDAVCKQDGAYCWQKVTV